MSPLQMFTATPAAPFAWSLVLSAGSVIVSLVPLGAARAAAGFEIKDLSALRDMVDRYPGWGKRANWAHQNSFEAFTLHAPAAILTLLAVTQGAELPATAVVAALAQPVLRLVYIAVYVANVAPARSLCWASGLLCTGILYSEGLKALMNNG